MKPEQKHWNISKINIYIVYFKYYGYVPVKSFHEYVFTSMIQGKLNYNDMFVTKHFFINIYSLYSTLSRTDDRWFGGGGVQKRTRIHPQYFLHLKRILICLLVVCNNRLKHIGFIDIHGRASLLIQINVSLVLKWPF